MPASYVAALVVVGTNSIKQYKTRSEISTLDLAERMLQKLMLSATKRPSLVQNLFGIL
jgi:hypothetical protein